MLLGERSETGWYFFSFFEPNRYQNHFSKRERERSSEVARGVIKKISQKKLILALEIKTASFLCYNLWVITLYLPI